VPGAIPCAGEPAASSYIQPQIRHIQVFLFIAASKMQVIVSARVPKECNFV
jgi:hypothetical protein